MARAGTATSDSLGRQLVSGRVRWGQGSNARGNQVLGLGSYMWGRDAGWEQHCGLGTACPEVQGGEHRVYRSRSFSGGEGLPEVEE